MRQKTRRRFLGEAAGSAAGAFVCTGICGGVWPGLIAGRGDKTGSGKMELKEFAAHVAAKFRITRIEPWSEHFRSLDKDYLKELAEATAQEIGRAHV